MNTEQASKNIFTYIIWQLFELACPMSSAIYDLFLYLQSEGWNISSIYPSKIPLIKNSIHNTIFYSVACQKQFIFLKCNGSIWDLGNKFKHKQIHLFWAFRCSILNFSLKEETMRIIHNRNVVELTHCTIVFSTQESVTCFVYTKILVWHLFSLVFLKPLLLYLI